MYVVMIKHTLLKQMVRVYLRKTFSKSLTVRIVVIFHQIFQEATLSVSVAGSPTGLQQAYQPD